MFFILLLACDQNIDTDRDGLTDFMERQEYGTDPFDMDSDSDGLTDGEEILTYDTDPLDENTDGDRVCDGDEVVCGLDPNTYAWGQLCPEDYVYVSCSPS